VFNFFFLFRDYYHYFSKEVLELLSPEAIESHKDYEESMRLEREKKKKQQFDFVNFEAFKRYSDDMDKYKKDPKRRKI
jgi:hypothetical protein